VASDVFGVSGRAMLRALIEGTATPEHMAKLARVVAPAPLACAAVRRARGSLRGGV